jgi:hypothetical protein
VVFKGVPPPLVEHYDGAELQPLGIGVNGIHDLARPGCQRADVQMVRRCDGEPHQRPVMEHRHNEGDVRTVAWLDIGVVVYDHITGLQRVAASREQAQHTLHESTDRRRLQPGGLRRLGQSSPLLVGQRCTEPKL